MVMQIFYNDIQSTLIISTFFSLSLAFDDLPKYAEVMAKLL